MGGRTCSRPGGNEAGERDGALFEAGCAGVAVDIAVDGRGVGEWSGWAATRGRQSGFEWSSLWSMAVVNVGRKQRAVTSSV